MRKRKMSILELHEELQRAINRLVDLGSPDADVAEAALTVALANMVSVHGPHRAAYAAIAAGGGLKMLAEQADADAAATRN